MALTNGQQAIEAIKRSTTPLIITRKHWTVDGIATSLALLRLLGRMGKKPEVVCDGFSSGAALAYLPGAGSIRPELGRLSQFVISLDVSKAPLDELYYDVEGSTLRITVTPRNGAYSAADVSGAPRAYRYDLAILVDVPDLASLGAPGERHAEFFRDIPTLAIGCDPSHERFANIDAIDVTCASAAESLHAVFASTGKHFLDADVATCLLAGIISRTRSFRAGPVAPKTLELSAALVAAGARREEIVSNLYRTRGVGTLKLWGRALARLGHDPAARMAWSVLTRQDFVSASADDAHVADILDELMAAIPDVDICCLLHERHDGSPGIRAIVSCDKRDPSTLVGALPHEPSSRSVTVTFEGNDIVAAERTLLETVRSAILSSGMR